MHKTNDSNDGLPLTIQHEVVWQEMGAVGLEPDRELQAAALAAGLRLQQSDS